MASYLVKHRDNFTLQSNQYSRTKFQVPCSKNCCNL